MLVCNSNSLDICLLSRKKDLKVWMPSSHRYLSFGKFTIIIRHVVAKLGKKRLFYSTIYTKLAYNWVHGRISTTYGNPAIFRTAMYLWHAKHKEVDCTNTIPDEMTARDRLIHRRPNLTEHKWSFCFVCGTWLTVMNQPPRLFLKTSICGLVCGLHTIIDTRHT